ncbi:MptD family putative ECF transporter S component [Arcanobacterium ihumii]|uniref:MptD family putative ECF transporter S component n=1 Tax=Arcanobacterium ihumii TaxID=2138162 RepID=UPI000F51CEAC|nr:MptD family putative ECF transporter S component [Arcanobacterium ihumii]
MPSSTSTTAHLNTRDFINIGVFTALIFVITFVSGMLGFFGPIAMFPGFFISIVANGIVFTLFTKRTPKMGAVTIMLIIIECLFAATGHWAGGIVVGALFGIVVDLIITRLPAKIEIKVPLAYSLFILPIFVSPWIPLFINADDYFQTVTDQMGPEYANSMQQLITPSLLLVAFAIMFVIAWLSGILGTRVANKHFGRAGLA